LKFELLVLALLVAYTLILILTTRDFLAVIPFLVVTAVIKAIVWWVNREEAEKVERSAR